MSKKKLKRKVKKLKQILSDAYVAVGALVTEDQLKTEPVSKLLDSLYFAKRDKSLLPFITEAAPQTSGNTKQ